MDIVDEDYTFADYWTHLDDQIEEWRHKSRMCAEILVPDVVPPQYIAGAYAVSEAFARKARGAAPGLSQAGDSGGNGPKKPVIRFSRPCSSSSPMSKPSMMAWPSVVRMRH
jgi:hypothetical protein